jgi:hypothetical protein
MPMAVSDSKSTAAHWLDKFDWDDVTDVEQCSENWFDEVKRELNVKSGDATALTKERFNSNKVRKDTLSSWLQEAAEIINNGATVKDNQYFQKYYECPEDGID